ncbi:hypothetical protein LTR62_008514 [Meristemomyces frigidus]|uniref:Uncharacterized protein n=1 Tax=Meristemomyces frigidus TaxID=1508187 RepID=A0AAN7TUL1_9PEZI|nr:hypothetical protein LTR62_008514 [Meristemomyces frigidus]
MIPIDAVREANAKAESIEDLVCVFLGGTGGIGSSTAKEVFTRTKRPRGYIIGTSEEKGAALCEELRQINPDGQATFIKKDISLLQNVDALCKELSHLEPKINCLFLTAGYMSLQGRSETVEGLDRKMSVNYYSRIRTTFNLLPNLERAAEQGELARVITVLAAGSEGDVRTEDLDLKHNFTLLACLAHCVVMTDFMLEQLAARHPSVSFSHSYPGTVKTGIANQLNGPARLAIKVLYAVMTPWIINVREAGERHFFQITNACYPPKNGTSAHATEAPEQAVPMKGSDGEVGSGAYLLDWDCKATGDVDVLTKYREVGLPAKVWEHTLAMFEQAGRRNPLQGEKRAGSPVEVGREGRPSIVGWRAG